jgi:hypothetical protein
MLMTIYGNRSRQSGVRAYAISKDRISVRFADGKVYDYTWASTGRDKVEHMKQLARDGMGLCTYISKHVGKAYAARR